MNIEEMLAGNPDVKQVRLTLSSRHILPDQALAGRMMSLFEKSGLPAEPEDGGWDENNPECWPDEMNDALAEISYMEGIPIPGEEQDGGDYDDPMNPDAEFPEDPDDLPMGQEALEELRTKFEQLIEMLQGGDSDEEAYVFETMALMTRERQPDGTDNLEISYQEDASLDNTVTSVLLNTGYPELVTIYRAGDVISTLICEKGKRHISAYETPVAPFEMAVYTRSCTGSMTFDKGGTVELDYIVELRGMDVQRTKMKITVEG